MFDYMDSVQHQRDMEEGPDKSLSPEDTAECDCCHEYYPTSELLFDDMTAVCIGCWKEYSEKFYPDYGDEYIEKNAVDFFTDWRFQAMTENEKKEKIEKVILPALIADYKKEIAAAKYGGPEIAEFYKKERRSFCLQSEDWDEFVRGKVS